MSTIIHLRRSTLVGATAAAAVAALGLGFGLTQSASAADLARFGGSDRVATGLEVYQKNRAVFSSDTVVLAGTGGFADALTASPLAAQLKAPVVTTGPKALDARVLDAMKAQNVKHVVVVGGTGAVSSSAVDTIKAAGMTTERLGGETRYETARVIAARVIRAHGGAKLPVFVADGTGYADALAAGAPAAKRGGVILLSRTGAIDPTTEAMIKDEASAVVAVGGGASRAMDAAGITATKVAGVNRYETAALLAKTYYPTTASAVLASGADYGDAVAGSPLAAGTGAPLLLTPPSGLPESVLGYLAATKPNLAVLGGTASIPAAVATKAEAVADSGDVTATTPAPLPTSTPTGTATTSPTGSASTSTSSTSGTSSTSSTSSSSTSSSSTSSTSSTSSSSTSSSSTSSS